METIGLVTWYLGANYGSVLQAYALRQALLREGFNVYYPRFFEYPFTLKNVKVNLFTRFGIRRKKLLQDCPYPRQKDKFLALFREEFPSRFPVTWLQNKIMCHGTDIFMAGSDQIWNCHDHFRSFEFLGFAGGKKRVSYASSIGTGDIPEQYREKVKTYLEKFSFIGVRESSAEKALKELTGRSDIRTVLDPTFLLTPAQWDSFAAGATSSTPLTGDYIFCYFLRKPSDYAADIRKVMEQTGISQAILLPSCYFPNDIPQGVTLVDDAGPKEFIKALRGAAYVLTDSFHGSALSVNFSRQFANLRRFDDSDPASQNSRLYDLADMFGTGNRFFEGTLPEPIDYNIVSSRLSDLRRKSLDFLEAETRQGEKQ